MKVKNRSLFTKSLFIACSATILLPSTSLAQNSYRQAPVNGAGNRDGLWAVGLPNWSLSPVGPGTSPWINVGSRIANFTHPEGGAVTVGGLVRLGGIRAGDGGEYTINSGTLSFTPANPFIDVSSSASGVLHIGAAIDTGGLTLNKTGTGTVDLTGVVKLGTLDLKAGTVSLSGNNLVDTAKVLNAGVLNLAGSDTIGTYTQTAGELAGSGTLTVTHGATLNGGTISANISGDITGMGDVLITGNVSGGVLDAHDKTMTLQGTSTHHKVSISSTGTLIVSNGGLDVSAEVLSSKNLAINADDTIARLIQSGQGLLSGSGILTVTGNSLISGTISGNHRGNIQVSASLVVTGSVGGGTLTIDPHAEAALMDNSSSTLTHVSVGRFGRFGVAENAGLLLDTMTIVNDGQFNFGGNRTIANYTQNGDGSTGILESTFLDTLTVTNGAIFKGGQIRAHLRGDTTIMGNVVAFQGSLGGGKLMVESGNFALGVDSSNSSVQIAEGALLDDLGKLDDLANVENAGTLKVNLDDSIGTYTQSTTGVLDGEGILTASGGATLKGGTISGNLSAETTVTGDLLVSGSVGGGPLSINSGVLTLTGVSTNELVEISSEASLRYFGNLGDTADIINSGTMTTVSEDLIGTLTNHNGTVAGTGRLVVAGPAVFNGGSLTANLFSYGGVTLNDGTSVSGSLRGNIFTRGSVSASGNLGVGLLSIETGTLMFTGKSTNPLVRIGQDASLKNSGNLGDFAIVTNAGTLTTTGNDIIGSLINNGGKVDGSGHVIVTGGATFNGGELTGRLTAYSGITLNDGTSISGTLDGNTSIKGRVSISGTTDGGNLMVRTGTLHLTGTAKAYTRISLGAALRGTGMIDGDVLNNGILKTDNTGDRTLDISGSLATDGIVKMSLNNASDFDRIKVGAIAALDGNLVVTNLGGGLKTGEVARIIEADSYVGTFDSFNSKGFDNGVLFDDSTGRLIGMAGGAPGSSKTYLNLNESQTQVYLSLYEDAVEIDSQNVIVGGSAPKRAARKAADAGGTIEFTSGLSDGDPQLIDALNLATFTDPGTIFQPVINRLSPEAHRGMADYAEQTTRAHVREALEGAPISRSGKTQIFASAHSSMAGVDSSTTDAGYDLQMSGFTSGIRYDINKRSRIGGLLGADDGSIEGGLIDTDAKGITIGIFGSHVIDDASKTVLTASLSHSTYDFDAVRQSFQGPVNADDIDSSVAEISLGVRTVVYEKDGIRISPHGTLRYLDGRVDGFTESGAGVPLKVGKQDIESLLLELGVEVEYKVLERLTIAGNLGYVTDFSDSSGNVTGSFATSGPLARQFTVSAPGVDDEAVVCGLGAYYDINETIRVYFSYRSDFRFDSQDAHSFGIGASFGF